MTLPTPAVKINLIDGSYNYVRYDDATSVQTIIGNICTRVGFEPSSLPYFAIQSRSPDGSCRWHCCHERVSSVVGSRPENTSFQMRLAFVGTDFVEFSHQMPKAFAYFFEQVKDVFFNVLPKSVNDDVIVHLAGLLLCCQTARIAVWTNAKSRSSELSKRRCDITPYVPKWFLTETNKKVYSKTLFHYAKKYAHVSEKDCMLSFIRVLHGVYPTDKEKFHIRPEVSNSSADAIVVSSVDICFTNNDMEANRLYYREISHLRMDSIDDTVVLQTVANKKFHIHCEPPSKASSLFALLSGHAKFANAVVVEHHPYGAVDGNLKRADGHKLPTIDGSQIELLCQLGYGHFGKVHKAKLTDPSGSVSMVAVKTCKSDCNDTMVKEFLREAETMTILDHPYIVKLLGVAHANQICMVMEFAIYGELRKYLHVNRRMLSNATLMLFCYQLAIAVSYLHSKGYIHRDIAARNVLVHSEDCVKLADFGLATADNITAACKQNVGKMPIKWMAPESIGNKTFSKHSDIWMLGVCMWEIVSFGEKPFVSLKNQEVYKVLVNGDRLSRPSGCLPKVYELMMRMWQFSAHVRPDANEVERCLREVYLDERKAENGGDDDVAPLLDGSAESLRFVPTVQPPSSQSESNSPLLTDPHIVNLRADIQNIHIEKALIMQRKQIEDDATWLENEEKLRAFHW